MRNVNYVARTGHFNFMTLRAFSVPTLEIGVDRSVAPRHQHPARFPSPCGRGDRSFEIVREIEHLRSRHEGGPLVGEVGSEQAMKLRWVDVSEPIWSFLDRTGLAEVAGEFFPVVGLVLSSIRHMGRDINQTGDRRVVPGFGDHSSAIAVRDENARA